MKKCLTKHRMSVRIRRAFGAAVPEAEAQKKKIEKRRKNFLTKAFGCVSISKLTAQAEAKTVPCKLNNVRQTKHLGQLKWIVQIDVKKSN